MSELDKVIETLDNAADSFEGIATKAQKKMFDEVITLVKDLDVDSSGGVKQTIQNLKRLTRIKAKLAALAKDKDWVAGIGKFVQYFGVLQKEQNAYFSAHFPSLTLNETAKKKNEMMKQLAVQNTIDALIGDGLKANVTDKLNDILLRAVTTNAKFADLQEELRAHLLGKDGGQGAFARYATTYATTALSQYTGQHNKLLTDDLDTEWFMYTGSNKETTREFCQLLTKKKYIHKSEIPTILTGNIDGEQCAIYPKTNLPYGMIEGTTPENFQCNCGGWNCRHQLVPVADAVVPKNIRDRFQLITNTREAASSEARQLPSITNGKVLSATPLAAMTIASYEQLAKAINGISDALNQRQISQSLVAIAKSPDFKEIKKSKGGGRIFGYQDMQYDYKNEAEVHKNLQLANKIAASGDDVYLVPNTPTGTSADYIICRNDKYYYAEGKTINGKNGIINAVNNGINQSTHIVVNVEVNLQFHDVFGQIKDAFSQNPTLRELWLYKGSRRIVVNRQRLSQSNFEKKLKKEWNKQK